MKLALVGCVLALGLVGCGSTLDVGNGNNGNGGGGTTALDGTWDITAAGKFSQGSGSQMTVTGSTVRGVFVLSAEGSQVSPTCVLDKDRREFTFSANGDSMSGTLTRIRHWTGTGCEPNFSETSTFSGVRTAALPAGPGDPTSLNGDWQVSGGGESWAGSLRGTAGTGSSVGRARSTASVNISVVGDMFSVSSSDAWLSFAARKR